MKKYEIRSCMAALPLLLIHLSTSAAGYSDVITYGNMSGWACLSENPDFQPEVVIKRDDGHIIATVTADQPREDAVRVACNSRTSAHGYSHMYSVAKVALIGTGDHSKWHWVHVYVKKMDGSLEELANSPKNLYFGHGIPITTVDVNTWPPQDSNKPLPPGIKSPPITVWPNNQPPTNIPRQPPPNWPCGMTCSESHDFAKPRSRINTFNPDYISRPENQIFFDKVREEKYTNINHLDERTREIVTNRARELYLKIKEIDPKAADDYASAIED